MKRPVGLMLTALLCASLAVRGVGAAPLAANSIQQLLNARVGANPGEGIIAGTIDHGHVAIYQSGSAGTARPLDQRTLFEIGSVTKTFTATVLARMVKGGLVKLDDPVQKYLPASVHAPSKDGKFITLRNLATQHSGLPRLPTNFVPKANDNPYADYSTANLYAFLNGYTLPRDPGAKFEYSNLGVGLLGLALSHAAHMDYTSMVRAYVWKPLQMHDTRTTLSASDEPRFAVGHDEGGQPVHSWEFTDALAGAGAIRSDMRDMLKYLNAAMGNGPLGSIFRYEQRPRASIVNGYHIGLIWWTDDTYHFIEHGGETAGYHSIVMMNAARTRGVVMLSNGPNVDDLAGHILNSSYPLAPKRHNEHLDPAALDQYVGSYENGAMQLRDTVSRKGTRLIAQIAGQTSAEIFASSPDHFYYDIVPAYVEFIRQNGTVVGLIITQNGNHIPLYKLGPDGKPMSTALVPSYPPIVTLSLAERAQYPGTYTFPRGTKLVISLANGHVFEKLAAQPALEIYPSAKDHFYLKVVDAQLVFHRDASGRIISVTLIQNGLHQTALRAP